MASKTKAACYVDTSALIAFLDRSDSFHSIFRRLFATPPALVTSPVVIVEGHGWFLRRYDARRASEFLHFIEELTPLSTVGFDSEELTKASKPTRKYAHQNLTLADAHGLAIMTDRRINVCWSTDWHLALGGARLVMASS